MGTKETTPLPRIFITEALEHHAKVEKLDTQMKRGDLGELVMDRDIAFKSKKQKISNWDAGRVACPHFYLITLSKVLKCTTDQLLGLKPF